MLTRWFVPLTFLELQRLRTLLDFASPAPLDRALLEKLERARDAINRWNTRREAGHVHA